MSSLSLTSSQTHTTPHHDLTPPRCPTPLLAPARTSLTATVHGTVVLSYSGAFDVAPGDVAPGRQEELSLQGTSARSGSLTFTNCGYGARMLYLAVGAVDGMASNVSTAADLSFFSAMVYDDEVSGVRRVPAAYSTLPPPPPWPTL